MAEKPKIKISKVVFLAVAVVAALGLTLFVNLKTKLSAANNELESLSQVYEEISQQNDNIEYLINDADDAERFEHLARERGYVYPDEKIYYDVTPGN